MTNGWTVIWFDGGRKLKKNGFEGDSPTASGAVAYAKAIIARGIPVDKVNVISKRKAFAPTTNMLARREPGLAWCPYCLKWREFRTYAIRVDGVIGPEALRCPICTISSHDYYVKKYNAMLVARSETKVPRLPKAKVVPARRR
jgi:hypothetical protein